MSGLLASRTRGLVEAEISSLYSDANIITTNDYLCTWKYKSDYLNEIVSGCVVFLCFFCVSEICEQARYEVR